METSTYIILALLAIFLFGPVSFSTPLRLSSPPASSRTTLSGPKTRRRQDGSSKKQLREESLNRRLKHVIFAFKIVHLAVRLTLVQALFRDNSPIPETSGNVHKITKAAEFDALLRSTSNVVVDFYADWCPPCRSIAPIFSKLADKHALRGHLAFAKVNVDHVNDIAGRYGVSAMPTFVFFEGGKPAPVQDAKLTRTGPSVVMVDGGVERIRGADPMALTAVTAALYEKVKGAAGVTDASGGDEKTAES